MPLPVCSAFLLLGQKYDIRHLYVEARQRFFQETPTTLEAYDGSSAWTIIESLEENLEFLVVARNAALLSSLSALL